MVAPIMVRTLSLTPGPDAVTARNGTKLSATSSLLGLSRA